MPPTVLPCSHTNCQRRGHCSPSTIEDEFITRFFQNHLCNSSTERCRGLVVKVNEGDRKRGVSLRGEEFDILDLREDWDSPAGIQVVWDLQPLYCEAVSHPWNHILEKCIPGSRAHLFLSLPLTGRPWLNSISLCLVTSPSSSLNSLSSIRDFFSGEEELEVLLEGASTTSSLLLLEAKGMSPCGGPNLPKEEAF